MSTDLKRAATQASAGAQKKPRRQKAWDGWTAEQGKALRRWVREHGRRFAVLEQSKIMGSRTSAALRLRWHRLARGETNTAPPASASAATAAHATAPSVPAATAPPPQMATTAA